MVSAAAVEWYRLKLFHEGKVLQAGHQSHSILSHRDGTGIVDMNVFWQVPQYLLVGLSEVRSTQSMGLLMGFTHGITHGIYAWDYSQLLFSKVVEVDTDLDTDQYSLVNCMGHITADSR